MKKILATLLVLFTLSTASAYGPSIKVIYGQDNRLDTYEVQDPTYRELAESTAAMVPNQNLMMTEEGVVLGGKSLQQRGMCSSERFAKQLTSAVCSGFLVGEDLLVTAGHCIKSQQDCNNYRWVFDYKVETADQPWAMVPRTSVYGCKKIISRSLNNSTKDDYALIKLNRRVLDRRILKYRKQGRQAKGDRLVVIGHPTGLPQKVADGARIRKLDKNFFSANLDTYGGNSGSAVFNADTGIVEGILVRGATDYVYDSRKKCRVSNRIGDNDGRGEDVTYITNIKELR